MSTPETRTVTYETKTYAGIEIMLIKRHMHLETGKFVVGVIIYFLIIVAVVINAFWPGTIDGNTLGYLLAGNSFLMASVKMKNIKEILSLK